MNLILQEETGLDVTMMSCGVSLIYSFFLSNEKRLERLEQELVFAFAKGRENKNSL